MDPLSPVSKKKREETLPPLREQTEFYDRIEAEMMRVFRRKIFAPLAEDLGMSTKKAVQNATPHFPGSQLQEAIRTGKVSFSQGKFSGNFDARISKELKELGAKWDRTDSTFRITLGELPYAIRSQISVSEAKYLQQAAKLERTLSQMDAAEIAASVRTEGLFDSTLWKSDVEIRKQMEDVAFVPKLTEAQRKSIAKGYSENLQLYVQKWTEEQILKMRKQVMEATLQGVRQEQLQEILQEHYGQSQSKAKFLARQETSLMLSQFRQTRYEEAGVEEYIWQCVVGSPKHPVRPDHKKLDGTRQRWDNPPITNEKGERNHPGQDFNCRCVARPIVKF